MSHKRPVVLCISACAMSVVVGGCSSDPGDDLGHLSKCANVAFPAGADVVWYEHDSGFRESTTVAVVDIPAGSVDEFKRQSDFAKFAPGVPSSWRSYWAATRMNDLLSTDTGNEHSVEDYRDPRRYVVIHNSGGETRKVFVHTDC